MPLDPYAAIEAECVVLRARPGFDEALLAYCRAMTAPVPADALAAKLFHRLSRYMTWLAVIRAHYDWDEGMGEAPSVSLVQSYCRLRPRQFSDQLAGLEAGRLVTIVPDPADMRRRLLRPSPAMVIEFTGHLRHYLALHDAVSPDLPTGHETAGVDRLGRLVARGYREAPPIPYIMGRYPLVYRFAVQDCGYHLLCAVMLTALRQRALPGDAPLSLRGLAERLGVSRAHVGVLLAQGRDEGLFHVDRGVMRGGLAPAMSEDFAAHAARNAVYYSALLRRIGVG